ncbi:hypothetical protein CNEO4_2220002 [Clostridium neonatale]|nr:hypothetical protein CNEO_2120004 [Clostridium neonatale]CAI3580721.1 hypothetical protein CNEO4_2220002 [Clostridium neonatale]
MNIQKYFPRFSRKNGKLNKKIKSFNHISKTAINEMLGTLQGTAIP